MKYLPILELSLIHTYFTDGVCRDYDIQPDPNTERLLRNHRCLFKGHSTGFVVLQSMGDDEQAFISLAPVTSLRFTLTLLNQDHLQYTDPKSLAAPEMATDKASGKHTIKIERHQHSLTVLFALDGALKPAEKAPLSGTITFKPRQAYWEYFVVTPPLNTATALTIKDASATASILFKAQVGSLPVNPIKERLGSIYPGADIHHFVSDQPIVLQHQPRKDIQLLINNTCLINNLPNPLLSNHNTVVPTQTQTPTNTSSFYELVHLSNLSIPPQPQGDHQ